MPKRHRPGTSAASLLRHIEDLVLATSGEDAFELVFAVAAARLAGGREASLASAMTKALRRHPSLGAALPRASEELLRRVDTLLVRWLEEEETLDAAFEALVPRLSKSEKGQYFTPRPVVDLVMRVLAPSSSELVVDPACGSGAFLSRARAAGAQARGCDVDLRAVRVARLLALASGASPDTVQHGDGLRGALAPGEADVVATNPPFAGRAPSEGFEVAGLVRRPERDVLFLERALGLLRPGGRLGVVLPYSKASGRAYARLRGWLVERARVLAVVGLPRETFLPHTSQRTFLLFAQKRRRDRPRRDDERTLLVVSERAGKDTAGEPIVRADGQLDHDLDEVAEAVGRFVREEIAS